MTQFWEFVSNEFGNSYGRVLVDDLALEPLSGKTARESLDAGVEPREVWLALCAAADVPRSRWHGRDKPAATNSRARVESGEPNWPANWPR